MTAEKSTIRDYLLKIKHFVRHSVLIQKNLPVLPRIIRGYFKRLVLRQEVLRTVEFTITADCNVNCEMCYAKRLKDRGRTYLTPAEYGELWCQARKLGAFSVILSGGEPTVRPDLFEVIAALDPHHSMIAIVSNSTMLDYDFLKRLKDSGVNVVHLSLNSTDPDENDRIRDFEGHYERVNRIIDDAKSMDFEVCLSTVVSHNELDKMRQVTDFAKRREVGLVFSLACPTGNWAGARQHLLTPEDWQEVDRFMKDHPYVRSDWTINLSLKTECPGGREKICISPYGDVMGCGMNFISHGNVREESLKAIWHRMLQWSQFKKRSKKCLIALDEEYLEEYLLPVAGNAVLPVPLAEHPVHPSGRQGGSTS